MGVWTTHQTDGMGSHGRPWRDAPHGLALSVAWPESVSGGHRPAWPIRLSLGVASVLESAYPALAGKLGVKWPNDIMCGQAKLAGVLVTRHLVAGQPWLVAGVGVNLAWPNVQGMDRPVTSLQSLGVQHIHEPQLVDRLCDEISALWRAHGDDIDWRHEFERRDVFYRHRVLVVHPHSGELLHEGVDEGVTAAGELMLRMDGNVRAIQIGEVSVRAPSLHPKGPA